MTHIHILGICGTFMAGLAILAREHGYRVTGSDENIYPPMSTQLSECGIECLSGYSVSAIKELKADIIVIGNAMSRGNPVIEYLLSNNIRYCSGPQWLADNILQDRWVLAVAGTHGKTTTSSMLAWILEYANMEPGFLIGGIPKNFGISARLGKNSFFVIEADEYDTAFFDKRSKFVHYRARTLILNNLEFDHADIFNDIDAIKTQFHHLLRIVPENGLIISNRDECYLNDVIEQGCWTNIEYFNCDTNSEWCYKLLSAEGSKFEVRHNSRNIGIIEWSLQGHHNIYNALAAIAAARHVGVPTEHAINALSLFENVKRRMELIAEINNIKVYDDFAHHPTAIKTTLEAVRAQIGDKKITVILEARSNSMKSGVFDLQLPLALQSADQVYVYNAKQQSNMAQVVDAINSSSGKAILLNSITEIVSQCINKLSCNENIVIMSNGGFENIHQRLIKSLQEKFL